MFSASSTVPSVGSRSNISVSSIPIQSTSPVPPTVTTHPRYINVPLSLQSKGKLRSLSQGSYIARRNIAPQFASASAELPPASHAAGSRVASHHRVEKSDPLDDFPPHLEAELNRLLQDDENSSLTTNSTPSQQQRSASHAPPSARCNTVPHSALSSTSSIPSYSAHCNVEGQLIWEYQSSTSSTAPTPLTASATPPLGTVSPSIYNAQRPSTRSQTAPPSPSLTQTRGPSLRRGSDSSFHRHSAEWSQSQHQLPSAPSQYRGTAPPPSQYSPVPYMLPSSASSIEMTAYSTWSPPLRARSASSPSSTSSSPSAIRYSSTHQHPQSFSHLPQPQQQQRHYHVTTSPQQFTHTSETEIAVSSANDTNTRLFFKSLPVELDNYNFLLQTFMKFGEVKSLTCNSKRRFALVEFATRDEAMLAKRECKKIQGPSGEVYRLKIFWGKDFADIKQKKNKSASSAATFEAPAANSLLSDDTVTVSMIPMAPFHSNIPMQSVPQHSPEQNSDFISTSTYVMRGPATPHGQFFLDTFNITPIDRKSVV